MLNMTPAAILGTPRGHGVSPSASRRASLPGFAAERDGGRGGCRWEEVDFSYHPKGVSGSLPLPISLALV